MEKMDNKVQELGESSIFQLLMQYYGPGLLGGLVYFTAHVVDRAFIGRGIGSLAFAAVSLLLPINAVVTAFALLFGAGVGSCMSIELGKNRTDKAEQILGNTFLFILITGAVMIGLLFLYMDPLIKFLGASDVTLPYAKTYLLFLLPSILFRFIFRGLDRAISSTGRPKYAFLIMLIFTISHISFNGIFIFGLKMELKGAAIAINIAYFLAATMVFIYFTKGIKVVKLRLKNFKLMKNVILPVLAIGLSPFLFYLGIGVVSMLAVKAAAAYGGDLAVAALGIVNMITGGVFLFVKTLDSSSQPIIGFNYGAKKYERVRETLIKAIMLIVGITSLIFFCAEFTPKLVITIFSKDTELIKIGIHAMRISFMLIILAGIQTISTGFFQAIGKPKIAILLSLTRRMILYIPFLLILPYFFNLTGIWMAAPIADFLSFIITSVFLYKELYYQNKSARSDFYELAVTG